MTYLHVRNLVAHYGPVRVLDDISFLLEQGQRLCLLGPSGCGKTTTLQTIAGFLRPDSGTVSVAGRSLLGVPAEKRNIGVMFQNYALFPHLSVFDNVAFGLRMRRLPEPEIASRVGESLDLVRLAHAGGKSPRMLSGGEQQRIAFARAVVVRPSLLLLDEPFSNLDARLRQAMRVELLALLTTLRIATVMVTHDQEEAMAIADHIVLMRAGRIEQAGTPSELYETPASIFSARFIGESNLIPVSVASADARGLLLGASDLPPLWARRDDVRHPGEAGSMLVRPERLDVDASNGGMEPRAGWNSVETVVESVVFLGHRTEYRCRIGPHDLTAWRVGPPAPGLVAGAAASVRWRVEDTMFLRDPEAPRA